MERFFNAGLCAGNRTNPIGTGCRFSNYYYLPGF
jgi:hypothetical protein